MDTQAAAPGFLQQLRHRKMAQWALAYAAGAWVLLQVLGLAGDSYEWPRIVMRVGFGLVVVGFLATLVLAWYHGEKGQQKVGGTELLILALLLTVGGGVLWRMERSADAAPARDDRVAASPSPATPTPAAAVNPKSIAVLPFANLSSDKDNAYFAEGIQDEILTRLAKIGDLHVISRTSTLRYASAPDNLPEIARQLGVANIVEGSVQRVGDDVRINVQLIQASTDTHLWAEIYDRKLEDVFSIQSEVAGAISDALQARLTQAEQRDVARKPTDDTAAYDAYLKGLSIEASGLYSTDLHRRARDQYLEATRLDPEFVEAWMHLVVAQSFLYFNGVERTPAALEAMRRHAETAARLRPDSGEAWTALGFYRYRGLYDYDSAVEAFTLAAERLPNNVTVLGALGFVERRRGRFDAAMAHLRKAEGLDPANPNYAVVIGEILAAQRRFADARVALERARALTPADPDVLAALAFTFQAEGDLAGAGRILDAMPAGRVGEVPSLGPQIAQLHYLRRFDAVIERMRALLASTERPNGEYGALQYRLWLAEALRLKGDAGAAKAEFTRAAAMLDDVRAAGAGDSSLAYSEAEIHMGLGEREAALRAIDRAIELGRGDARDLPNLLYLKAVIHARFGERDAALALLERALGLPYGATPALLRLDPQWDALRADARFRRLAGG
jgi:TolB-like protein/Tfp pilus assembly protein PilF